MQLQKEGGLAGAGGAKAEEEAVARPRASPGEETELMRLVREFVRTTAAELEAEVAQLTRRATVAEEQLVETNALMAQYALRAQREVGRLRALLARYDPAAVGYY